MYLRDERIAQQSPSTITFAAPAFAWAHPYYPCYPSLRLRAFAVKSFFSLRVTPMPVKERPRWRAPFETAAGETRPPQGERYVVMGQSFSAHPEEAPSFQAPSRR